MCPSVSTTASAALNTSRRRSKGVARSGWPSTPPLPRHRLPWRVVAQPHLGQSCPIPETWTKRECATLHHVTLSRGRRVAWRALRDFDVIDPIGGSRPGKRVSERDRGLSSTEASRRLALEGPNVLPGGSRRGALAIVGGVLREPMFTLLVVGALIYLVLGDVQEAMILAASILV